MIDELELTCKAYPKIHARLQQLKMPIQKSNYLSSLIIYYQMIEDKEVSAEIVAFISKHGGSNPVDHSFTFRGE